jgi:hypothetical protein
MAITKQNDRRKGIRREVSRRKGEITTIEVEGKEDKEQERELQAGEKEVKELTE